MKETFIVPQRKKNKEGSYGTIGTPFQKQEGETTEAMEARMKTTLQEESKEERNEDPTPESGYRTETISFQKQEGETTEAMEARMREVLDKINEGDKFFKQAQELINDSVMEFFYTDDQEELRKQARYKKTIEPHLFYGVEKKMIRGAIESGEIPDDREAIDDYVERCEPYLSIAVSRYLNRS